MSEKIAATQRMLNCVIRYYARNADWPGNTWLSRDQKITPTGVKTLLRTLAVSGAVELDENVQVIGSASVRKNWATISILSSAA